MSWVERTGRLVLQRFSVVISRRLSQIYTQICADFLFNPYGRSWRAIISRDPLQIVYKRFNSDHASQTRANWGWQKLVGRSWRAIISRANYRDQSNFIISASR